MDFFSTSGGIFRAGNFTANDLSNLGSHSAAFGYQTQATYPGAVAYGNNLKGNIVAGGVGSLVGGSTDGSMSEIAATTKAEGSRVSGVASTGGKILVAATAAVASGLAETNGTLLAEGLVSASFGKVSNYGVIRTGKLAEYAAACGIADNGTIYALGPGSKTRGIASSSGCLFVEQNAHVSRGSGYATNGARIGVYEDAVSSYASGCADGGNISVGQGSRSAQVYGCVDSSSNLYIGPYNDAVVLYGRVTNNGLVHTSSGSNAIYINAYVDGGLVRIGEENTSGSGVFPNVLADASTFPVTNPVRGSFYHGLLSPGEITTINADGCGAFGGNHQIEHTAAYSFMIGKGGTATNYGSYIHGNGNSSGVSSQHERLLGQVIITDTSGAMTDISGNYYTLPSTGYAAVTTTLIGDQGSMAKICYVVQNTISGYTNSGGTIDCTYNLQSSDLSLIANTSGYSIGVINFSGQNFATQTDVLFTPV